jgi:hypothetical protein
MNEETMKEEANRVLREAHNNEHREAMRLMSLIHNAALLVVYLIMFLIAPKWWTLFLLILWDWSYNNKKNSE